MLSSGIQRRSLLRYQSGEMETLNILFPQVEIEPTKVRQRLQSHACAIAPKRPQAT